MVWPWLALGAGAWLGGKLASDSTDIDYNAPVYQQPPQSWASRAIPYAVIGVSGLLVYKYIRKGGN